MKTMTIFILLVILFSTCKKDSAKPMTVTAADIQGKWRLISETLTGTYDNKRYAGFPTEFIEYKSDRKAYSSLQGQGGLVYSYNLNPADNTLNFMYISTAPNLLAFFPCTGSPGCPRVAGIKYISKNLLVLGNTFRATGANGDKFEMILLDSLSK
ncbi:MAG: hypothetical protein ABI675_11425 [Chitinophagaceae bacterium]